MNDILGDIESISFGGKGILRHEGFVIFVPFTAPGETVQIQITEQKPRFAQGQLVQILSPSPLRCAAVCPYFGTCGGCQLQHLLPHAQTAAKKQFTLDALQRIGQIKHIPPFEVVAAQSAWEYRRHIRLLLKPRAKGFQMGYTGEGYVCIDHCALFLGPEHPLWKCLPSLLASLTSHPNDKATLRLIKTAEDRLILAFDFPVHIPSNAPSLAARALDENPFLEGIAMRCGVQVKLWGQTRCCIETLGLHLDFSAFGFVQNHPAQSALLYQALLDAVPQEVTQILDLYCGIGVTSLLLARQGLQVIGVESHPETVELASANAEKNKICSAVFHAGKAEEIGIDLLKQRSFDLVLCNPPRPGLDPHLLQALTLNPPPYIAYISCMPSTMARDLKTLIAAGYAIDQIHGFDLFPQTTHVETLILLRKRSSLGD